MDLMENAWLTVSMWPQLLLISSSMLQVRYPSTSDPSKSFMTISPFKTVLSFVFCPWHSFPGNAMGTLSCWICLLFILQLSRSTSRHCIQMLQQRSQGLPSALLFCKVGTALEMLFPDLVSSYQLEVFHDGVGIPLHTTLPLWPLLMHWRLFLMILSHSRWLD